MCLTLSLTHCVTKRPHCVINSGAFKEKSVPSPLATNVPELLSYGCGVTLRGTEWMRSCGLSHFSCVQFFVALWTIARWAPLSMGILPARILEWAAMPSHSSILAEVMLSDFWGCVLPLSANTVTLGVRVSLVTQMVKKSACNAEDLGSMPRYSSIHV